LNPFRRSKGALLTGVGGGVLAAIALFAVIHAAGLFDEPPSVEEMEQAARERGLEGPLTVVPPEPDHFLTPTTHGPYLLVPLGWQGDLPPVDVIKNPAGLSGGSDDLETLRSSPLWREPSLPAGFALERADSESLATVTRGYYSNPRGESVLSTYVALPQSRPIRVDVWTDKGIELFEATEIDGLPAVTWRSPSDGSGVIGARMFDAKTGIEYLVEISDTRELGLKDAIDILRSSQRQD
jgi:hypothetical protein